MRATEFVFEARRNPQQNPKVKGAMAAVAILQQIPQDQLKFYGVSMNDHLKLGVNPKASYSNTPAGVYFYPANYYIELAKNSSENNASISNTDWAKGFDDNDEIPDEDDAGEEVPFRAEAKYINIIQLTSNKIIDFSTNTDVVAQFEKLLPTLQKQYNFNMENVKFNQSDNPGINVYNKIFGIAKSFQKPLDWNNKNVWDVAHKQNVQTINLANKLIRMLGYDVVIDYGVGYIHENEPTQGVCLTTSSFKVFRTIDNSKVSPPDATHNYTKIYRHQWSVLADLPLRNHQYAKAFADLYYTTHGDYADDKDARKISRRLISYLLKDQSVANNIEWNEDLVDWITSSAGIAGTEFESFIWNFHNQEMGYENDEDDTDYSGPLPLAQHKQEIRNQKMRQNQAKQKQLAARFAKKDTPPEVSQN